MWFKGGGGVMKCIKCGENLVESNINFEYKPEDMYYTRYFCFNCETLYSCTSHSGDMIEEYLEEIGQI